MEPMSLCSLGRQSNVIIVLLLLFLQPVFFGSATAAAAAADPRKVAWFPVAVNCATNGNYTQNSTYQVNLNTLLSNLTAMASITTFYHSVAEDRPHKPYGLFICREDLSQDTCHMCVQEAVKNIVKFCPNQAESVIYYLQCTLRYANRTILGLEDITLMNTVRYSSSWNVSDSVRFNVILTDTVNALVKKTVNSSRFFATMDANFTIMEHLYTLAQCTPGITPGDCLDCLSVAISEMRVCCMSALWFVYISPNCQMRFDTASFFNLPL